MPEGRVQVIDTDTGDLGTIPENQLEAAQKSGRYRAATKEDIAYFEEKKKYDDPVKAAILGTLSMASLGGSDLVISAIGGERARRAASKYEEHNPIGYAVGNIVGAVSPGGVEGLAAKGVSAVGGRIVGRGVGAALRAPSAPGRALMRMGAKAERAVGGGVRGMALRGAVEGVGYGSQQYIHEYALGDADLNGEKLAEYMLNEGVVGGGLGGMFGIAGAAAKGIGRGLRSGGRVSKKLLYNLWGDTSSAITRADRRLYSMFDPTEPMGLSRLNQVRKAPKVFEGVEKHGKQLLTEIADDLEEVNSHFKGVEKIKNLERHLPDGVDNIVPVYQSAVSYFDDLNKTLLEMSEDATQYSVKRVKDAQNIIYGVQNRMWEKATPLLAAKPTKENARALAKLIFKSQDDVKKYIGDIADDMLAKARKPGARNRILFSNTGEKFNDVFHRTLRPQLENESLWGDAAKIQKQLNEHWKGQIAAQRNFEKIFHGKKETVGLGAKKRFIKDNAWKSHVYQGRKDPHNAVSKIVTDYLNETASHASNVGSLVDLPAATQARIARIEKNTALLQRKLSGADRAHHLMEMFGELKKARGLRISAPIGWGPTALMFAGQPAAGAAMWGGLKIADSLSSPVSTINALAGAENLLRRHGNKMAKGVSNFTKGTANTIRRVESIVSRPGVTDKREDYNGVVSQLRETPPEVVRQEALSKLTAEEVMPDTSLVAADTLQRYRQHMLSYAPTNGVRPHLQAEIPHPSKAEEQNFMERVEAARRPQAKILEDMNSGRLTDTTVNTVKSIYPEQFQELTSEIFERVLDLDAADRKLPFEKRLQLAILLDEKTDGLIDIKYLQEQAQAYAMTSQMQQPQSAGRGESIEISQQYEQGSQRTERGTWKA